MKNPETTDEELLALIKTGDRDAFEVLYGRWVSRLLALAVSILVDRAQAEEILQETLLEVWRTAGAFDPSKGSARAWLVTMTRRRAIDRVRSSEAARRREERRPDEDLPFDVTAEAVETSIVAKEVRDALEALGEPHKTTIELAYFTGLTHRQIAEQMNTPLGTVKTRIRDGVARLGMIMGGGR
ncbi:sigma-70 family RNA polymerase sigma factor [Schaalia cardiffensis]|uniref:sigma-70 family RNA polymerase sigma factor n=1 Tax=Schaalia cardiffensis TaxID=181487 RepID=UPI0018E89759|nr:sigma-70 family RNA polymerase sigma factor [Schaalia cardiffensis]